MHDEWEGKYGNDPHRALLVSDCDDVRPTLRRALAILIKIHKGEITSKDKEHTNSIILLLNQLDQKHKSIENWAATYGVHEAKGKKGAKRKVAEIV